MNKSINEKLLTIQAELKTKKSRFNNFGKYYFRSAEDILEAIKPHLVKHKVSVVLNEELVVSDPPTILSTATISDGTDALIDDTADADATNAHGKGGQVTSTAKVSIKEGDEAFKKAQDYIKAGGSIDTIKTKYAMTADVEKSLTNG